MRFATLEILRRKHQFLLDIGKRHLIYPRDTTFIHDLSRRLSERWIQAGWDVKKTILLEIDYPTIPAGQSPQTGIPSDLFAGHLYAWSSQAYFRIAVFSRGFFDNIDDRLLRISTWHEKQHVIDEEKYVHHGVRVPMEEDVLKREEERILKTFGREGLEARLNHALLKMEKLGSSDAIPGSLALLWMREYFGEHCREYAPSALPIPVSKHMEILRQRCAKSALHWVGVYDTIGEKTSNLLIHTFKDMDCQGRKGLPARYEKP